MTQSTGWVFISHSHLDFEVVRKIRNKLESLGFNPLTFFLKCLTDEDEIADLIKREIRERDWFVFINSENSRSSRWVSTERDYIEEIGGKNVFVVDASAGEDEMLAQLEAMTSQMQVTLVSLAEDEAYREPVEQILLAHDYIVRSRILARVPETEEDLVALLDRGTTILLVTENNRLSDECHKLLESLVFARKGIMPLYSEHVEYDDFLHATYGGLSGAALKKNMDASDRERVFTLVRQHICAQRDDFLSSEGFRSARVIRYPEVGEIPDYAFTDCPCLEEVFIPDSVIYISSKAFFGNEDVLVHCSASSHAASYCESHGLRHDARTD